MALIEKYYQDSIDKKLIKAWWLRNLQMWYVFFYEKKGRKSNLVLGKESIQYILNCVVARDIGSLASLCEHVWLWDIGVPLNTRCQKVVVVNGGNGYVKINIQK